jgi:hypothetical protein
LPDEVKVITVNQGTAEQWNNQVRPLESGEFGYDTTNRILKIGDGVTSFAALPAFATGSNAMDVLASLVGVPDGLAPLGPDGKVPDGYLPEFSNLPGANLPEATQEYPGIVQLATDEEATAGTVTDKAVSPNQLKTASASFAPSSQYVDISLGASGSLYTPPADGWVQMSKKSTGANQYILLGKPNCANFQISSATQDVVVLLPVTKDYPIEVVYTVAGTLNRFRFTYAKGAI